MLSSVLKFVRRFRAVGFQVGFTCQTGLQPTLHRAKTTAMIRVAIMLTSMTTVRVIDAISTVATSSIAGP